MANFQNFEETIEKSIGKQILSVPQLDSDLVSRLVHFIGFYVSQKGFKTEWILNNIDNILENGELNHFFSSLFDNLCRLSYYSNVKENTPNKLH